MKELSLLDIINAAMKSSITLDEWTDIRNNGTTEEIAEAWERVEAAGGYENLE